MKIYGTQNVLEAALDRLRFLYREFPVVICNWSGGKDSTVCLHLCLRVAGEMNRLPQRVMWIDQEVEWQGTVDLAERVMTRPDVQPMWFQMPMVITNNASSFERFNYCWRPEDRGKWAHPQHPLSIKVNRYGTIRFHDLFGAILDVEFPDTPACYIAGVRTQESPRRAMGLTAYSTYKWITWGRKYRNPRHFTFHPIYDWTISDVWKAIHEHGWEYNRVYDQLYQYGVPVTQMRISNLHHETAIKSLTYVQELEPETWRRVADRITGANTVKHLKKRSFTCPEELPFMFRSWEEYAEHLIENIVQEEANRRDLRKIIAHQSALYPDEPVHTDLIRVVINTILSSDWDFTKLQNWLYSPTVRGYWKWRHGYRPHPKWLHNKYIPDSAKPAIREALKDMVYE